MGVIITEFGKTKKDKKEISKYTISNSKGMKACVINYGAILTNLFVPDKDGNAEDIVLGYDRLKDYFKNGSFFGATIGPNANRIANASFSINGTKYQLDINDGPNNLHSDFEKGYHKQVFDAEVKDNSVTFSLKDSDGNMGFPGNKSISVTYTVTEDNELSIHYEATSDADTVINMTNHTYFNLNGHKAGNIENHTLCINAEKYTPVVMGAIPTGELAPVKDTVFDFTAPKKIGDDINKDVEQLKLVKGYDHNWVLDNYDGNMRKIATVSADKASRTMEVYTDLPGVQFYAGNCIGKTKGKEKMKYYPRYGLCLETQYYPNTANEESFPGCIYGPDRKYDTTTIYKFV